MRVGIDGACWLNRRGYGRFARELVTSLAALGGDVEYTLVVDFDPAEAPPLPAGVRVVRVPAAQPAARAAAAAGRRSLSDLWATARAIRRERFDLVFFPSAYTYVPFTGPGRVVVVIHDVIPEQFPGHVFPTRRAALHWWLKILAARRRADLVMTVSEASKAAIVKRFDLPAERVAVVSEAADAIFRPLPRNDALAQTLARWNLADGRFVLYVGGISPHKNLGALIDAFAEVRRQAPVSEYKLVLAGDYAADAFYSAYDALRSQVHERHLDDVVIFTGYVEDAVLAGLYSAAAACVLPSLWEGFGLPVIEAMACGAPVLASARGALPEVVGGAGVTFDPEHPGDLARALGELLCDANLQARLRRLGPERAAEFSWEQAARQALAAFHEVMRTPHRRVLRVPAPTLSQKGSAP
jgi:glycosyltransferase involved in cell wall biosynthesis